MSPPLDAGIAIVSIPLQTDQQALNRKHHYDNVGNAGMMPNSETEMDLQETAIGADFLGNSFSPGISSIDLNELDAARGW